MALPDTIDLEANYRVTLARPIGNGIRRMIPRDEHTMLGAYLQALVEQEGEDAFVAAEPVE